MIDNDDATLLRAWTHERSEEAFRRLVERYAALVHGVARRLTGSAQFAAEAAQDVFLRLARRAGSIRHPEALASWLHTAATRAAADRVRAESRYRERVQRVMNDAELHTSPAADRWHEALPLLDRAIKQLSTIDREIVLARYYHGASVAVTAKRLGLSPAAAQKRGERALARLSQWMNRRGVALTTGVLAVELPGRLTAAPPAGLSGTWAAHGIKSAALPARAAGWMAFIGAKSVSVTAAIVAAAVPVTAQLVASQRDDAVRIGDARSGSLGGSQSSQDRPHVASRAAPAEGIDLAALQREIRAFPPGRGMLEKELELRAAVLRLDASQCAAVAETIAAARGASLMHEVVFDLFSRWTSLDKEGALAAATGLEDSRLEGLPLKAVFHAWAARDAPGLIEYFAGAEANDAVTRRARHQAVRTMALTDPHGALGAARRIDAGKDTAALDAVLWAWADAAPDSAISWLENSASPEDQSSHRAPLLHALAERHPDKAFAMLLRWPDGPLADNEVTSLLNQWAAHDPEAAVEAWLRGPEKWRTTHQSFNLSQVLAYSSPGLMRRLAVELPDAKMRAHFAAHVERLDAARSAAAKRTQQ